MKYKTRSKILLKLPTIEYFINSLAVGLTMGIFLILSAIYYKGYKKFCHHNYLPEETFTPPLNLSLKP